MFSDEALERFRKPKNSGDLDNYNARGRSGDPICSDVIELFISFKDNKIRDAKFKVFGCPGAISTTDVFIDLIKGKSIKEATAITEEQILDALGGLPNSHMHCSGLPLEAFKKAVEDYENKR